MPVLKVKNLHTALMMWYVYYSRIILTFNAVHVSAYGTIKHLIKSMFLSLADTSTSTIVNILSSLSHSLRFPLKLMISPILRNSKT